MDIDWGTESVDNWIIIECYRALSPGGGFWNDYFLKRYLTTLIKRQWGQNLIKFRGTKLPGGIELNGREIYDDAEKELAELRSKMSTDYEMPPLDLIG